MAFTQQEMDVVTKLASEGRSPDEIASYIGGIRMRSPSSLAQSDIQKSEQERAAERLAPYKFSLAETGTDIAEAIKGVGRVFDERSDVVAQSMRDSYVPGLNPKGTQLPLETAAQIGGQALLAVGDTLFELAKGVAKAVMPEAKEQEAAQWVEGAMQDLAEVPGVQETAQWYANQSPRTQRNLAIPIALLELAGLKAGTRMAERTISKVDDLLPGTRQAATQVAGGGIVNKVKNALDSIPGVRSTRYALSDIDTRSANAIRRSSEKNIRKHAEIARDAMEETTNPTNIEYVGDLAEDAYRQIQTKMSDVGTQKASVLDEFGDIKLTNNPAGSTIDDLQSMMSERFGVRVNPDGTVSQVTGRISQLDAPSTRLLAEYTQKLRTLGIKPTVRQVDDFIDWAQGKLYKQKKSYAELEAADKPVIEALQEITGSLNGKLKQSDVLADTGYADINAEYARLLSISDELSRGLGAEGRKGGAFVKRVFSPSDARTKELFEEIYQETGINLADEATLAKYFMDSVGDSRQTSLLKEVMDVAENTNQVELTKPGTWLTWLRENADMDGEELALEILRRAKEAERVGDVPEGTVDALRQSAIQQGVPENKVSQALEPSTEVRQGVSSTNNTPGLLDRAKGAVRTFIEDVRSNEQGASVNPFAGKAVGWWRLTYIDPKTGKKRTLTVNDENLAGHEKNLESKGIKFKRESL